MSATNRGGERSEADFYRTPQWPVHRLLERCDLPSGDWLEFGAGEGDIIKAVDSFRYDLTWTALELRDQCRPSIEATGARTLIGNALNVQLETFGRGPRDLFDVSFGNPPFRWAMEFVHQSLRMARWTALLLRLNFLAGDERRPFMGTYTPDVYVIPDRISFTGDGGTDATEHAWFVWPPKRRRPAGRLVVLDSTPLAERKAQMVPPSQLGAVLPEQKELFA